MTDFHLSGLLLFINNTLIFLFSLMSSTLSEETESASQGVFVRIPVSDEAKKRAQRDFQAAIEAGAMPVDGLRATAHDACLRSVETTGPIVFTTVFLVA